MSAAQFGGDAAAGVTPSLFSISRASLLRGGLAFAVLAALLIAAYGLHHSPEYGANASFSLLIGAALGVVFERGRFCFFCILRDGIEYRDSRSIYAILMALAVGGIGYALLFGAFLPNAMSGRLPANAHIGPVSWVTFAAGLAFGLGMALSGACISGHLYRLGEGYARAPIALFGALLGFALGFYTWETLYVQSIAAAPSAWLPASLGYEGALVLHLLLLGGLALLLLRRIPPAEAHSGGPVNLRRIWDALFAGRWNPLVTGALVGLIGIAAYFRIEPLGVTAQLGSISRTVLANQGLLEGRLPGLDRLAGCATQVVQAIMDNGFLIGGLVLASFAMALLAKRFEIGGLTTGNGLTALLGGILMGWGAMSALGCTVGTLLSGISAFALSGWVFGAAVVVGVWLGIRLRLVS